MSDEIRPLLQAIVPSFAGETGDWQRVLADAEQVGPSTRSASRPRLARWARRPVGLAVAFAVLALCPIAIGVIATRPWWLDGVGPRRDSPVVAVLSTTWGGQRWTVSAYANDKLGICLAVSGPKDAGALSCDRINGVPRPSGSHAFTPHDISPLQAANPQGQSWIAGEVSARITRVAARLSDGSILRAATAPAPRPLHARVRFFLIRAPRGPSLWRGHPPLPHGLTVTRIAGYADGKLTACMDLEHFRLRAPLGSCRF